MNYQNKTILGGFMGNLVEAYDMSVCYFSAMELSHFLLGSNKSSPTVLLFLIFIAHLAKPMGAFVLGLLSDLYGRKNVLIGSILIMGISTSLIGLIPTYDRIGILAAGLFLLLRFIQSAALGSEFLNSASLLVESGATNKRGFRGCWSSVGGISGNLLACLVVASVHYYSILHPEHENLWRIPFLLIPFTTAVGFYIRNKMPESLSYVLYYANQKKPSTAAIYQQSLAFIKKHPFMLYFTFFSSLLTVSISFFFYLYIPLHALEFAQISRSFIIAANALSLLCVGILTPIFGWISDKNDRLTLLSYASAGLLILAYPYMYAVNFGNAASFTLMQVLISIPTACYFSVSTVLLTELFPLQIRCTTLSLVYSIAASLAAGLPPLISDYLVHHTNMPCSPSLIIIVLSIIVLLNVQILRTRYRSGVNEYKVTIPEQDAPIFTVQYHKP